MDPVLGCRLGLHDENMLCEVITIENYCYALVFREIFLSTDHAVSTGASSFWDRWRDLLPFFSPLSLLLWNYHKLPTPPHRILSYILLRS